VNKFAEPGTMRISENPFEFNREKLYHICVEIDGCEIFCTPTKVPQPNAGRLWRAWQQRLPNRNVYLKAVEKKR
jgi:hypothetical protein